MKTPTVFGVCAAILLGAGEAFAEQDGTSTGPSSDPTKPKFIACAQETGEPLGQCSYRIKQDKSGMTTVTVVFENGFKRGLFFMDGKFQKGSATMSGTGTDTDWSQQDGVHMIRVDDQRYEVPAILIEGR